MVSTTRGHQFIAGQARVGAGGTHPVINPATGETVVEADLASPADVDAAVSAATAAFADWSRRTPAERSDLMATWARLVGERADDLARTESTQTGKTLRMSQEFDVPGTVDNTFFFAGAARHLSGLATGEYSPAHTSSIRREPLGVIGSIAPWNYPLQMAAWKLLPAVAAGNTVVLKPSELTPLTTLTYAEAAQEAGIPDGVINVLNGTGAGIGDALVGHPGISMVSFTGSTGVGRRVGALAAGQGKRVHLELGGKAPFVVYDDADLEAAIHGAVAASMINTGQDCTAATRAIVHSSIFEAFCEGVADLMAGLVLGDPFDPDTDLGPVISKIQQTRVIGHVATAVGEGAVVRCGGSAPEGPGAFFEPTLITGVHADSSIMRDEVFGPVLAAMAFDTDDESIELANHTAYGLAASAWTRDVYRANRASREINAGCVWINDHIPIISEMPHGGYKASGTGKDMSSYSFEEYTQIKHVMHDITGVARKGWQRTVFTDRSEGVSNGTTQ